MATVALPRPTPAANLNPSQSQSSAPVFEYRCMFTHDVRKKAKKWHDGSLRFHTFNKRVMVYDDAKNLVGSLHYRLQEDFGEGLELNLDSHVLVQVEEQLGESATDLTALLSRQKQDGNNQNPSHDAQTRATVSRINAASTQKPKSIKELLSGSQGVLGRARMPIKSPYEQRHPLVETQSGEPDAKRRRITYGKENVAEEVRRTKSIPSSVHPVVNSSPARDTTIVDISSDKRPTTAPTKVRKKAPKQPNTSEKRKAASTRLVADEAANSVNIRAEPDHQGNECQPTRSSSSMSNQQTPIIRQNKTKRPTVEAPAELSPPKSMTPDIPLRSSTMGQIRHPIGPRSSLKFAAYKPRPKLMYRALLGSGSRPTSNTPGQTATPALTIQRTSGYLDSAEQSRKRPRSTTLLELDKMLDPSQIERDVCDIPNKPDSHGAMQIQTSEEALAAPENPRICSVMPSIVDDPVDTIPDSPLFLPRTASQMSPTNSQDFLIDVNRVSLLSQALQNERVGVAHNAPQTSSDDDESLQNQVVPASSPAFESLLSTGRKLTPEASNIMEAVYEASPLCLSPKFHTTPLPSLPPILPAQVRPFRRVVSESIGPSRSQPDSLPGDDDDDSDGDLVDGIFVEEIMQHDSPGPNVAPARPPSFSDPVDIRMTSPVVLLDPILSQEINEGDEARSVPSATAAAVAPSLLPNPDENIYISVEESGPWTTTEAFLLFDRWPPGRQKPAWAAEDTTTSSIVEGASGMGEGGQAHGVSTNLMSKKKYGTFGSARFVSQR